MLSSGRCTRVAVESEPQNLWQFRNPHLLMLLWFVVASLATFGQSTVVSTPSAICAMAEISWFHGAVWTRNQRLGTQNPKKGTLQKGEASFRVSHFLAERRCASQRIGALRSLTARAPCWWAALTGSCTRQEAPEVFGP